MRAVGVLLAVGLALVSIAWIGGGEDDWALAITAVSQRPCTTNLPPYATVTATNWTDYEGEDVGWPVTIESWIREPALTDGYAVVRWQYSAAGEAAGLTNWVTLASVTNGWDTHVGYRARHHARAWTPPCVTASPPYATNYLVRIYGETSDGRRNGSPLDTNLTSEGGGTWQDAEIVGIRVNGNKRPGF